MEIATAEKLITGGVGESGGTWADLGAGTGTFTLALANLLGPRGTVHAVDRDLNALRALDSTRRSDDSASIVSLVADFREPLDLSGLDGVLMANALHFVPRVEQARVLANVVSYLRPGGAVLLVEYEQRRASPWVPYPVPRSHFTELAAQVGLSQAVELGCVRSRFGSRDIYAAVAMTSQER